MAKIGCAKCGGTKKMALGGSAVKKAPVQLYGIPQQNMGTSSQMGFGRKGGTLNEMARGGTKKSTASKAVQAASRKVLADKALAARTAGANKANAGKIASKPNLPAKVVNTTPVANTKPLSSKPANRTSRSVRSGSKPVSTGSKPVKTGSKQIKTGKGVNYKVGSKPVTTATIKPVVKDVVKPVKAVAPILGPDTRNKAIQKNAKRISTKSKDGAKVIAKTFKNGRKMNQTVLLAERSKDAAEKAKSTGFVNKIKNGVTVAKKMKLGKKALIGAGITAAAALVGYGISKYKKVTDKPKADIKPKVTPKPVTPKPVAKSSGSTKKYTSPNTGTTTTINTKPNGEKQTKVTTYAGRSFYKSTHVNPKGSSLLDKVKKAAEDTKGNKAGDGSSLKRPTNLKPITKTDTNANGTKTTIYIDASGNRHVKVVKKDGTTFTSNDKPKVATTPKVETKKTTPKVTAKVADKVSDEVTKMETKRPSAIETKNPADLKIIEPASKASSTSSSSTSSSSAPTTVPRANLINKVKSNINASRERRAERAESRGNNDRATKLRDKEKATQAKMMKKGGSVKSFPDLNKDGKVTKADILKGRGIIKKKGGVVKTKKK